MDHMDVKFILLADAANVSVEGKLNITGIFNAIGTKAFPAVWPQMQVVIILQADATEQGQTKTVDVQLAGPDGQKVLALGGKVAVPKGEAGYPVETNHILGLSGVKFEKPGDYVFTVLINGDPKGRAPLMVREIKPTQKAQLN